ncbi:hypothetical protein [Cysteiniphilum marinum]|uniref:hypothetical protein n=1 Tax=Cysteiniphilum marinum TaxID=2774191 RepID=UPI0019399483|nr:hypothetical protein [Cysteiniphilum marinum]
MKETMKKRSNKLRQIGTCVHNGYLKSVVWLSGLMALPLTALADRPRDNPFGSLGLEFKGGENAGKTLGTYVLDLLWYLAVIVLAVCIITAIVMGNHLLHMTKDQKEEHGVIGRWITVMICVATALALGYFVITGINNATA